MLPVGFASFLCFMRFSTIFSNFRIQIVDFYEECQPGICNDSQFAEITLGWLGKCVILIDFIISIKYKATFITESIEIAHHYFYGSSIILGISTQFLFQLHNFRHYWTPSITMELHL